MSTDARCCETCAFLAAEGPGREAYMFCTWEPPAFATPLCGHGADIRDGFRRASERHRHWQTIDHVFGTADICTKHGHAKAGTDCPCWVRREDE